MSARWLEMILILRSQIWVQYNLRLTAVISSTTSTSSSSNVITELAVGAARLDGAERGECLMKGQMEQDTWRMKGGSMGAKDHEFQEGGRESSAVENSKKWGHILKKETKSTSPNLIQGANFEFREENFHRAIESE